MIDFVVKKPNQLVLLDGKGLPRTNELVSSTENGSPTVVGDAL